jgi:hypothetical protein
MLHSVSIILHFVLIQFVDDVCEDIICIKHLRTIRQIALLLFIFSILFELSFPYLGYKLWENG